MSQWITEALIEDRWGAQNVEDWSTTEPGGGSAAATRIANAIKIAEERIEDRFRGSRYAVPLVLNGNALERVKYWASTLAGCILYETRGRGREEDDKLDEMRDSADRVHADIAQILWGMDGFDAGLSHDGPTGPEAV